MLTTLHHFEDFEALNTETVPLPPIQARDHFEAGLKTINALADDMSLDILTLDFDELN